MNFSDTRSIARSAKKASVATKTTAPARRPVAAAEDEPQWNLSPGFRNRLVGRLDASGVPQNARTAYVAALTERAPQTVSRWLAAQGAGLPDLESCARLCQGLRCSADWMLGMDRLGVQRRNRGAVVATEETDANSVSAMDILDAMVLAFHDCEPMRMIGDEMSPKVRDGDVLFVDRSVTSLSGNGVYALEQDGRVMIREVENRIGTGLVFRCENPVYKESVVKNAAAARRLGLRVLGRVNGAIRAVRFHGL